MKMKKTRLRRAGAVMLIFALLISAAALPAAAAAEREMDLETFASGVAELHRKYDADRMLLFGVAEASGFPASRLIVKADARPDVPEAIETFGGYHGYYLLQFADPGAAKAAMETLAGQGLCAAPDAEMTLSAEETASALQKWSSEPDPLGIQAVRDRIAEKYGDAALPEITVAVLDSGAETDHPMLQDRLLPGYDLHDPDAEMADAYGHGTFVAGIIAGATDANVRILPMQVTDSSGRVPISYVVTAIEKALACGAQILNMSFGAQGVNDVLEEAVAEAIARGAVIVAAAGNDRKDAGTYYPAGYDGVVTVSNLRSADTLNTNSNYGACVELAAPGTTIYGAALGGGMKYMSGTSFSTPFVSAAAALAAVYAFDAASQTAPDAEQGVELLYRFAADIGRPGIDDASGYGRLDLTDMILPLPAPTQTIQVGERVFSAAGDAAGDGWRYAASDHRLTLMDYCGGSISSDGDLTIISRGRSEIVGADGLNHAAGLWIEGDLTLLTEGTGLVIRGGDSAYGGDGIYVQGSLCLSDVSTDGLRVTGGSTLESACCAGYGIHCPKWGSTISLYSAASVSVTGGATQAENCGSGVGLRGCAVEIDADGTITGEGDAPGLRFTERCVFGPFRLELIAGPDGSAPVDSPGGRLTPEYAPESSVEQTTSQTLQITPTLPIQREGGVTVMWDETAGQLRCWLPIQQFDAAERVYLAGYRQGQMCALHRAAAPEQGKAVLLVRLDGAADAVSAITLNEKFLPLRENRFLHF